MLEKCHKYNYYFSETMKNEILSHNIISFDIFETALQYKIDMDSFFETLTQKIETKLGIADFGMIRAGLTGTSFDSIYEEIQRKHPEFPIEELKKIEKQLISDFIIANPIIKEIYDAALESHKQVIFLSDSIYSATDLEPLLQNKGFRSYEAVLTFGDTGATKSSSELYHRALEQTKCSFNEWLHIGSNSNSDCVIPRTLGITAAYYPSPRYWASYYDTDINEFALSDFYTKTVPEESTVIDVDNVSMMFNMCSEKVDNIKEYVIRLIKRQLMFQEFWALQNISFKIHKGEKVGLIGLNGSGKSTLLKIVSGVMKPTKGKLTVLGSIAPMIELGAGFDPELSAKENIFLNGAILGYSHEQMEHYYNEIIDFSELYQFQDIAIKNFSSGMVARLGFAIATCHVPDILIIDEILSVGDIEFQKKCHKKIDELTQHGATVLFVSHSPNDIINMCDRAIWLDHGKMIADGEAHFIVEKYLNKN